MAEDEGGNLRQFPGKEGHGGPTEGKPERHGAEQPQGGKRPRPKDPSAAVVDRRRRLVSQLWCRKMSQREIVEALKGMDPKGEPASRNPDTGEPWSLGTINADCQALDSQWREQASGDVAGHKARVYAELQEVKRGCWLQWDPRWILKSLEQEAKLLGLNSPDKIAPTSPNGEQPYEELTEQERVDRVAALLRAARERMGQTVAPEEAGE